MHLDDTLGESQPDTDALRARVQLLEQLEDPLVVTWIDPHSVISHKEDLPAILPAGADLDERLFLPGGERGRILDQILEHFAQAHPVAVHHRQARRDPHRDAFRLDDPIQRLERLLDQSFERHVFGRPSHPADPGELQQLGENAVHLIGRPRNALEILPRLVGASGFQVLLHRSQEPLDSDQRRPQVVKRKVCEPFDLGVDRLQAGDQLFALRLRCPLPAPVFSIHKPALDRRKQTGKPALEDEIMRPRF